MPWQRQVADVALELLPDGSWAYRTVCVTVQRQAGKTTLMGPVHLHRALTRPQARTWLTAQTRQDARDTWLDVADRVKSSPLRTLAKIRESNGSESVGFPSGGYFRVFAPTEDALHGKANQMVTVDEVWAFDAAEGAGLLQAIRPTFTTTGGQLWLVSTAGTARSTWLRSYVDRGRAAVDAGRRDGIAYFEWSLDDQAADVVAAGLAPDATQAARDQAYAELFAAHPADGITLDHGSVRDAAEDMGPSEVLRAYGNRWTETAERVIPAHLWDACKAEHWPVPEPGQVALAFDVSIDRKHAAICAAWRDSAAAPVRVDVVEAHPGDGWLVARLRELNDRWRPVAVGYDDAGPARDIADELQRGGMPLAPTRTREYTAACAAFLGGVTHRRLEHRGVPALDDAVEAAAKRPLGDAWAWSRGLSAGSIAPLVAATVASWTYDHRPPPAARPVIMAARRGFRA